MSITVAGRRNDNKSEIVPHPNAQFRAWNGPSTKTIRRLSPDLSQLSGLARFLAEELEGRWLEGRMPHPQEKFRVIVQNGRTEAEEIMYHAETYGTCNCVIYRDRAEAVRHARAVLAMYDGYLDRLQQIDDWLWSVALPSQSDEEYFIAEANRMIAAAQPSPRVIIGDKTYDCQ